jgi:peptidoglycan/LPS O-acetylase OafA/YrhL
MVTEATGPLAKGVDRPPEEVKRKARAAVLDGVRGWAALGVLLTHVAYVGGVMDVGTKKGWPVASWLSVGLTVTLAPFFLLSGMLLYRSFARATFTGRPRPGLKSFFVRRILRIIPTYWVMVAVVMLTINLTTIPSAWWVLRPFLLLHFFLTDGSNYYYPGLEITWSVTAEFVFYLLLPIGAWLIDRYARKVDDPKQQLKRMCWSVSPFVVLGLGWEVYTHLPSSGAYPVQMYWPPNFLGVMAIGMMLGASLAYHEVTGKEIALFRSAAKHPLWWWTAALAVFLINCWKPFTFAGDGDYPNIPQALMDHIVFILWGLLIVVPLIAPSAHSRVIAATLGNKVSVFLGRISFGVYLWHFPMIYYCLQSGSLFGTLPDSMNNKVGTVGFWQLIVEVVAGSIVLSTLTHYLVERPVGRLGARIVRGGTPTAFSVPLASE